MRVLQTAYDTKQASQDALDSAATTDRAAIRTEFAAADALKANSADVYTQSQVDTAVGLRVLQTAYDTKQASQDSAISAKQDALTDAAGLNINSSNVAIGMAVGTGGARLSVKGHASFENASSSRKLTIDNGGKIEAAWQSSDALDLRIHGTGAVRVSRYNSGAVNVVASIAQANTTINSAQIVLSALPTSDPGVVGQLWRSGADLKISI